MGIVEASGSSPAICRECGSTISVGELRFGRQEGHETTRRLRWRHLACAATHLPSETLRALEIGGWRRVPEDDHSDLRQLIERARTEARIRSARGAKPSDPSAARSHTGMAAAAVLAPAHRDRTLPPQLAQAWVHADALQDHGDPRGELLALELAAEHTDDAQQARSLNRRRRDFLDGLHGSLHASERLRLRYIGGFLLAAHPKGRAEIERLLAAPEAADLSRVRVDFCTGEDLAVLVARARDHQRSLAVVDLDRSRLSSLKPLAELPGLAYLRVGDRLDTDSLRGLAELSGFATTAGQLGIEALAALPELEVLELQGVPPESLVGLGTRLPRLRRFVLRGSALDTGPEFLAGAEHIEELRFPDTPIRGLGRLPELPALETLSIVPASLRLVGELGSLAGLRSLALSGGNVGELDVVPRLAQLEQLALHSTRVTDLTPLRELPGLTSLTLSGGDLRRISGLSRLSQLTQLSLRRLANLDLARLRGASQLHTLVLETGGRRPRSLDSLGSLPALRKLSLSHALLASLSGTPEVLSTVEVLECRGGVPSSTFLAQLPQLRRLLLPECSPQTVVDLGGALPDVLVRGEVPARDLLGAVDPFDWRAVSWPER